MLLAETALRAIPVEPNLYLDEGDSNSIHVLVLDRGRPTSTPVQVTLATVDSTTPTTATQFTGPDGVAEFPVTGTKGQVESFVLMPGLNPSVPSEIDPQTTTYLYLRTLPADAAMAGLDPTWANVYMNVLRNWHAMAPCMDNWLRLGDPAQVKAYATLLKKLTGKSNFESFRFMPVTRDLTAGQRTLLYNFLDGAKPAIAAMTTSPPATPGRLPFEQLSRSLRGG